jgi:hypothetical protein
LQKPRHLPSFWYMAAALSFSIIRLWIAIPIIWTTWLIGRGKLLLVDTLD